MSSSDEGTATYRTPTHRPADAMPAAMRWNSARRSSLDAALGIEVGLRVRGGGEWGEVDAGLEVAVGVGRRAELGMRRHDVTGGVLATDPAVRIAVLGGEKDRGGGS